eukprot:403373909
MDVRALKGISGRSSFQKWHNGVGLQKTMDNYNQTFTNTGGFIDPHEVIQNEVLQAEFPELHFYAQDKKCQRSKNKKKQQNKNIEINEYIRLNESDIEGFNNNHQNIIPSQKLRNRTTEGGQRNKYQYRMNDEQGLQQSMFSDEFKPKNNLHERKQLLSGDAKFRVKNGCKVYDLNLSNNLSNHVKSQGLSQSIQYNIIKTVCNQNNSFLPNFSLKSSLNPSWKKRQLLQENNYEVSSQINGSDDNHSLGQNLKMELKFLKQLSKIKKNHPRLVHLINQTMSQTQKLNKNTKLLYDKNMNQVNQDYTGTIEFQPHAKNQSILKIQNGNFQKIYKKNAYKTHQRSRSQQQSRSRSTSQQRQNINQALLKQHLPLKIDILQQDNQVTTNFEQNLRLKNMQNQQFTEEEQSYINHIIKDMQPHYMKNQRFNIFMMNESLEQYSKLQQRSYSFNDLTVRTNLLMQDGDQEIGQNNNHRLSPSLQGLDINFPNKNYAGLFQDEQKDDGDLEDTGRNYHPLKNESIPKNLVLSDTTFAAQNQVTTDFKSQQQNYQEATLGIVTPEQINKIEVTTKNSKRVKAQRKIKQGSLIEKSKKSSLEINKNLQEFIDQRQLIGPFIKQESLKTKLQIHQNENGQINLDQFNNQELANIQNSLETVANSSIGPNSFRQNQKLLAIYKGRGPSNISHQMNSIQTPLDQKYMTHLQLIKLENSQNSMISAQDMFNGNQINTEEANNSVQNKNEESVEKYMILKDTNCIKKDSIREISVRQSSFLSNNNFRSSVISKRQTPSIVSAHQESLAQVRQQLIQSQNSNYEKSEGPVQNQRASNRDRQLNKIRKQSTRNEGQYIPQNNQRDSQLQVESNFNTSQTDQKSKNTNYSEKYQAEMIDETLQTNFDQIPKLTLNQGTHKNRNRIRTTVMTPQNEILELGYQNLDFQNQQRHSQMNSTQIMTSNQVKSITSPEQFYSQSQKYKQILRLIQNSRPQSQKTQLEGHILKGKLIKPINQLMQEKIIELQTIKKREEERNLNINLKNVEARKLSISDNQVSLNNYIRIISKYQNLIPSSPKTQISNNMDMIRDQTSSLNSYSIRKNSMNYNQQAYTTNKINNSDFYNQYQKDLSNQKKLNQKNQQEKLINNSLDISAKPENQAVSSRYTNEGDTQRKFFMSKLKIQLSHQSGETQTFTQGNENSIMNLATPISLQNHFFNSNQLANHQDKSSISHILNQTVRLKSPRYGGINLKQKGKVNASAIFEEAEINHESAYLKSQQGSQYRYSFIEQQQLQSIQDQQNMEKEELQNLQKQNEQQDKQDGNDSQRYQCIQKQENPNEKSSLYQSINGLPTAITKSPIITFKKQRASIDNQFFSNHLIKLYPNVKQNLNSLYVSNYQDNDSHQKQLKPYSQFRIATAPASPQNQLNSMFSQKENQQEIISMKQTVSQNNHTPHIRINSTVNQLSQIYSQQATPNYQNNHKQQNKFNTQVNSPISSQPQTNQIFSDQYFLIQQKLKNTERLMLSTAGARRNLKSQQLNFRLNRNNFNKTQTIMSQNLIPNPHSLANNALDFTSNRTIQNFQRDVQSQKPQSLNSRINTNEKQEGYLYNMFLSPKKQNQTLNNERNQTLPGTPSPILLNQRDQFKNKNYKKQETKTKRSQMDTQAVFPVRLHD